MEQGGIASMRKRQIMKRSAARAERSIVSGKKRVEPVVTYAAIEIVRSNFDIGKTELVAEDGESFRLEASSPDPSVKC